MAASSPVQSGTVAPVRKLSQKRSKARKFRRESGRAPSWTPFQAAPGRVAARTGLRDAYLRQTLSRLKGLGAVRTIGHTVEDVPGSNPRRARATVYARNY